MLNLSITKGKNYRFLPHSSAFIPSFTYLGKLSMVGCSRETAGRRADKQEGQKRADYRQWCGCWQILTTPSPGETKRQKVTYVMQISLL